MKVKKVVLGLISSLIILAIFMQNNNVFAADVPAYFGIAERGESGWGYSIGNPASGRAKLYNIVKYNSATDKKNYDNTINAYCVRAGQGFNGYTGTEGFNGYTGTGGVSEPFEYKNSFDMRTQKATIIGNKILYTANTKVNGTNITCYEAILSLSDIVALKENIETEKENLITKALEKYGEKYENFENIMTNDDIIAVQQSAIWYFSNYDDTFYDRRSQKVNEDTQGNWLYYVKGNNTTFNQLSDYNKDEGKERNYQAKALYNYLINEAIEQAESKDYIGNNKVTLYTNLNSLTTTQPVIIIEKGEDKKFDLALRKYITKVNGVELKETRVPNIDTQNTLDAEEETAKYKHRKDPVQIKTGDTITYNLSIYNEGEVSGRATKIIDQLPAGLKLKTTGEVTSQKGNKYSIEYSGEEGTNQVILTTTGTNNLNAYKQGTLDSDTITIECEVTETRGSTEKVLTNVAWIAEEYNASKKETINTDKVGADRDSAPGAHPNVNKNNMSDYKGDSQNKNVTPGDKDYYYKGQQDDDDFEKLVLNPINPGSYNIVLVKEDAEGEQLNSTAKFQVNGETKNVTGRLDIVTNKQITAENVGTADVYTIKELEPPDEYCKFDGTITITVNKKQEGDTYVIDGKPQYKVTDPSGKDITDETKGKADVYVNEDGNIYVEVKNYQFDLKLIKRITEVNNEKVPERIKSVDITKLADGSETTADYKLDKNPVSVKKGDIVKYTFRVYNEGEIDGYAAEITEDIPEGLEFIYSTKTGDELNADTTLTEAEKEAIKFNQQQLWSYDANKIDENGKIQEIKTNYLSKEASENNLIKAFDKTKAYTESGENKNPDYKEVSVMLKVTSEDATGKVIRNEACISKDTDGKGNEVTDRDSDPNNWKKYEDDEDYDNIKLNIFDLSLRKFIIAVSEDETIENEEYMKNEDGTYTRAPQVDTSELNPVSKAGEDGEEKTITTATYNHTKEPVELEKGDYVVYCLRVYNEGNAAGYAAEVTDHLPEYLEYVEGDFNKKYGWSLEEDGKTIKTSYLAADQYKLEPAKQSNGKVTELYFKDVPILCKVKDTANINEKITNIADITKYEDENHKETTDRDSKKDNVKLPENWPGYNDDKTGEYIPGQEDDDDFEKVIIYKTPEIHKGVKTIENQDSGYDDNEEHQWVIASDIPGNIANYEKYAINDDIDYRLNYVENSVNVYALSESELTNLELTEDKKLIEGTDYKLDYTENEDNEAISSILNGKYSGTLKLTFIDGKGNASEKLKENAGKMIVVTFNTTFAKDSDGKLLAEIIGNEVPNKAELEYKNSKGENKLPSEEPEVHVGGVTLFKFYNNNENKEGLEGAEFEIFRNQEDATERANQVKDGTLVEGTKAIQSAKSDKDGLVKFVGLEYGEDAKDDENNKTEQGTYEYDSTTKSTKYWVVETKSPENYTIETNEPIEVEVNKDSYNTDISTIKYQVENKPEIFDLALRKWVTQAIVIEDGKEKVTNTGHQPYDDPEGIVKVELNRKKLDKVKVKFRYSIRVINEGQIEGYAKEVTDYIPEGLQFVAEDNPGWTDKGNNVITTRLLENTLLKPGEYKDIEVLLTWKNNKDNMGLKTNTAEISEDYNEKGIPDRDSTPNNKKPGEDDIDDAPVMLAVSTGMIKVYITLGLAILVTLAGGVALIKKYVL